MTGMAHHPHAVDWSERADELERDAEMGLPWITSAVRWIAGLTTPHTVLDLGSGPGVASCVLAAEWASARVVAIDESPQLLARVEQRARRLGLADRVATEQVDIVERLPTIPPADLIWASRVLHHVPDVQAALGELAARLRPDGVLALVEGGLPSRYLPDECGVGAPGLLTRLDVIPPHVHADLMGHRREPVRTALDWPVLLGRAGLRHLATRSFLLDLCAPVTDAVRDHAVLRLERTRDQLADQLSTEDRVALDRLLDPADELGVRRRPDVFWLSAFTVHCAAK
jgi:SAM-dependent methyltransferase